MSAKKTQEVAVVEQKPAKRKRSPQKQKPRAVAVPMTMEQVFMEAIRTPDLNPANLEKLVELKERLENKANEKLFNGALALAQQEMKPVRPSGFNKQTSSEYPKLEEVNTMAMPIVTKHGFSLSCTEEESKKEGHIRISGTLSHSAGHSRQYAVNLPIDQKGIKGMVNKTPIHATGSTFTYGRRYLTMMIFNISIVGADDDGQAAGKVDRGTQASASGTKNGVISAGEVKRIEAEIGSGDEILYRKVTKGFKIDTLDELKKVDFKDCLQRVKEYKQAKSELKKDGK